PTRPGGGQERILHRLLGVGAIADDALGEPHQRRPQLLIEQGKLGVGSRRRMRGNGHDCRVPTGRSVLARAAVTVAAAVAVVGGAAVAGRSASVGAPAVASVVIAGLVPGLAGAVVVTD